MLAIALDRLVGLIPFKCLVVILQLYLLWWVSTWVYDRWKFYIPTWSDTRGTQIREAATSEEINPTAFTISQFSGVRDGRALELTEQYHLH